MGAAFSVARESASLCEPSQTFATGVVVCDFVYVGDQKGVGGVNADSDGGKANLIIARRCVAQNKITVVDTLFKVPFEQMEMF